MTVSVVGCGPDASGADAGRPDASSTDASASDGSAGDADTHLPDGGTTCPSADTFVGDPTWGERVVVTEDAVFCATFDEVRETLAEELAAKARVRIAAGTYRLPLEATTDAPFFLPLCFEAPDGIATTGTGTLDHVAEDLSGTLYHQSSFELPLAEGHVEGHAYFPREPGASRDLVVDGTSPDRFGASDRLDLTVCADDCWGAGARRFDSCTFEGIAPQHHTVSLADGEDAAEVRFEIRIGTSPASTEPAAFVRAEGTFGGEAFVQTDYFHLVYHPSHHHFERAFAVLFDAPIEGVCGIEVDNLEAWDDYTPDEAYAVDCTLTRLRPLTVTGHVWER